MRSFIVNILLILSIIIVLYCLASCSKGSTQTQSYVVTEEDAAEIVSNSVLASYGGLLSQTGDGITLDQKPTQHCGLNQDSTVVGVNAANNTTITYNKSLKWQYQVSCTDNSLTGDYSGSCSYSGLHFSAVDQCSSTITMTLPVTISPTYLVTLSMTRNGVVTKKAVGANVLQTVISIRSSNLSVDYNTRQVISGQMTASVIITSGSANYSYNGTIKFLGAGKAMLTLNSGTAYPLTL